MPGFLDKIAGALQDMTAVPPAQIPAFIEKAKTMRENGDLESALKVLSAIKSTQPDNPALWKGLGDTYSDMGRSEDAIEAYIKAISLAPDKPEAYLSLGTEYLTNKQLPEAQLHLMHGLLLSEQKDTIDLYNLALSFYQENDADQALPFCEMALKNGPDHDTHELMADCLFDLERYDQALPLYEKAMAEDTDNPRLAEQAGFTLERLGRHQDAISALLQAQQKGSEEAEVYASLSRCYEQTGQTELSQEAAAKYYELAPPIDEEVEESSNADQSVDK